MPAMPDKLWTLSASQVSWFTNFNSKTDFDVPLPVRGGGG